METDFYSNRELALAAQERLALMHNVEHSYTVGKNKIVFKLNGSDVFIYRDYEKTTGFTKSIVECDNCFPLPLFQNKKEQFTELDLEKLVVTLDRYFINEVLGLSPKLAICNSYHYLKKGLVPFFPDLADAEDFVLQYMAAEADSAESMNSALPDKNSIIFLFLADTADGQKLIVADADDFELRIDMFRYDDGYPYNPDYDGNVIEEYVLSYAETPDLALAVATVLEGCSNIRLCSAKLSPYIEPEQESDDD